MSVVRFLFGSGGWVCWYLSFWAIILFCVVMVLEMFRRELKPRGEKPATMSLGSCMVGLIGCGLGFVTMVNGLFYSNAIDAGWWTKLVAVGIGIAVAASMIPVNCRLAELQSRPSFWANLILSVVLIAVNLYLMHVTRTAEHFSLPLSATWPAIVAVVVPCIGALGTLPLIPPLPQPPSDPHWYTKSAG